MHAWSDMITPQDFMSSCLHAYALGIYILLRHDHHEPIFSWIGVLYVIRLGVLMLPGLDRLVKDTRDVQSAYLRLDGQETSSL
jgi:hypothetical protein